MLHNSLSKAFKNIYDHVLKKVAQQYTLYLEFVGKGVSIIALSNRQKRIAEIVRLEGPITGEHIAQRLNVTRAALRSDLAILIMGGILDARPKVGYYYTGKNTLGMLMEEISNICVKDLQSVPIAIGNDKSAYEAIVTMFLEDVGSVFILDEAGLLAGVVSRKDLLKAAINNADLHSLPVVMVMTPLSKIIVANEDESVAAAGRDRQTGQRPSWRSLRGAAGSAGQRAEPQLPGSLPGDSCGLEPSHVYHYGQYHRYHSPASAGSHGSDSSFQLYG